MKYGLHWFRRDLRIKGNPALQHHFKHNQGKVVGVFVFDPQFLKRSDFSKNRFAFFLATLKALKEELQSLGSDLLVLDQGPQEAFSFLLNSLKAKPTQITFCRDYEPFSRRRDKWAKSFFKSQSVEVLSFRDHLLIEPHELFKSKPGETYQVYTPFSRKWNVLFQERLKNFTQSGALSFNLNWSELGPQAPDSLEEYIQRTPSSVPLPEAGNKVALKALDQFKNKLEMYKEQRDVPALNAGSGLSVYLKNGSLAISQIIKALSLKPYVKKESSSNVFLSELIWREFYYHILFHHPRVEKESFLKPFQSIAWNKNQKWFELWKEGQTGFPIVDAGMRELKTTGLMHNRVRMIVASFLTKDLLLPWQWGERHFMEHLLDGDLAANNGGWQWAASTGCDAQPYFRIFNPWLQSKKFDPEGKYIKQHVTELSALPSKSLHGPILNHPVYPSPMVDHSERRQVALAVYQKAKES